MATTRGQGAGSVVNNDNRVETYNVTVHTNATSGIYRADIQMARALAHAG